MQGGTRGRGIYTFRINQGSLINNRPVFLPMVNPGPLTVAMRLSDRATEEEWAFTVCSFERGSLGAKRRNLGAY